MSSTSRENLTSSAIQQSSPIHAHSVSGASQNKHKEVSTSEPVFSQQLRDPRQSISHSSFPVRKFYSRNSDLHKDFISKQPEEVALDKRKFLDADAASDEEKAQTGEPASFPKGSLLGFRIPKHGRSLEDKLQLPPSQTGLLELTGEKGHSMPKVLIKTELDTVASPSILKSSERGESSEDSSKMMDGRSKFNSTSAKKLQTSTNGLLIATKELPNLPPEVCGDHNSIPEQPLSTAIEKTTPQLEHRPSDSLQQCAEDSPGNDLISLFKNIDSSTLQILASTIKLALTSAGNLSVSCILMTVLVIH